MKISVQRQDFNLQQETELLRQESGSVGAIVTFTGLVRDFDHDTTIASLFLEHYPGMTEASLEQISVQACTRWKIINSTIIHRVGELHASEQIVFVGVSSQHRQDAFAACEFIMDYLKTQAPFWKKSRDEKGEHWLEAKCSDTAALDKWQ